MSHVLVVTRSDGGFGSDVIDGGDGADLSWPSSRDTLQSDYTFASGSEDGLTVTVTDRSDG